MKFSVWTSKTKVEDRKYTKPSQCKKTNTREFNDTFLFYGYPKEKKSTDLDDKDIPTARFKYYLKELKRINLSTK